MFLKFLSNGIFLYIEDTLPSEPSSDDDTSGASSDSDENQDDEVPSWIQVLKKAAKRCKRKGNTGVG